MKLLVSALLVTLALTTGFTCSKNAPAEANQQETAPPPVQDQMGAPAPADGTAPATEPATEPEAPAPGH